MSYCTRLAFTVLTVLRLSTLASADLDAVDWVSVDYVLNPPANARSATRNAQASIVGTARKWASQSSFSVVSDDVKPPSGDPNDYLSWAPYHWPDCNWCAKKGGSHLAHPGGENSTSPEDDTDEEAPPFNSPSDPQNDDIVYERRQEHFAVRDVSNKRVTRSLLGPLDDLTSLLDPTAPAPESDDVPAEVLVASGTPAITNADSEASEELDSLALSSDTPATSTFSSAEETLTVHDSVSSSTADASSTPTRSLSTESSTITSNMKITLTATIDSAADPSSPIETLPLEAPDLPTTVFDSSSSHQPTSTRAPARHAAQKDKCKPSPSKPMPPSATWTTCPYERRDGKANPDVRTLPGVGAIQHVSDAIRLNAMAYVLEKDSKFAQQAVRFVKAFFIDAATRMNPHINFGQIVRGPGASGRTGTWTGVLDLRGMVKVLNGISLLKASGAKEWSASVDAAMDKWMSSYSSWLVSSPLGKELATRANNHVSFYVSQVAATRLYAGDKQGAVAVLQKFFDGAFKDQIAKSGEQPFEAARTRPQHYRAFNIEALIVNAKLGDQVGKNFWSAKSKYGATIQNAVDFSMKQSFKNEDPTDLVPHVAAVAAQYGDPSGKYAAFLKKYQSDYQSQPFWFYDQAAAFSHAGQSKRSVVFAREEVFEVAGAQKDIPFECPAVFEVLGPKVPLDLDLYVTCDELRSLYETV